MTDTVNKLLIVTHDGPFHADDLLAVHVLESVLNGAGLGTQVERSRRKETIERADFLVDVGGEFDAARGRFDHHMVNAPKRENGRSYSAFGLVWREMGRAYIARILAEAAEPALVDAVHQEVDDDLVRHIDAVDCGYESPVTWGLSSILYGMNPLWNEIGRDRDHAFQRAQAMACLVLNNAIRDASAAFAAQRIVSEACAGVTQGIIDLPARMPWRDTVPDDADILFAVYPVEGDSWLVETMNGPNDSLEPKKPFPKDWWGLRDSALVEKSGVTGATFVHQNGFIGGADTRDGALAMAHGALRSG